MVISDYQNHTKYAVWTFLKKIVAFIKKTFPFVRHLIFVSDNDPSQFRSKHTASNICFLADDFNGFLVEYHGKDVVDGIGGKSKNLVWTKVKHQNLSIKPAEDYFKMGKSICKKTVVFYVPKVDILANAELLDARWSNVLKVQVTEKSKVILGIGSLHHLKK